MNYLKILGILSLFVAIKGFPESVNHNGLDVILHPTEKQFKDDTYENKIGSKFRNQVRDAEGENPVRSKSMLKGFRKTKDTVNILLEDKVIPVQRSKKQFKDGTEEMKMSFTIPDPNYHQEFTQRSKVNKDDEILSIKTKAKYTLNPGEFRTRKMG